MGLFKAVINRFRTKKNELTKKLSDPYEDGKLAIEDAERDIENFVERIMKFTAQTAKLRKQREEHMTKKNEFAQIAKKAVDAKNMEDAKEAIETKLSHEASVKTLADEISRNEKILERLRDELGKYRKKVRDARRKLEMLNARKASVDMRKAMNDTTKSLTNKRFGIGSLDVFEDEVDTDELELDARDELEDEDNMSLVDKYDTTDDDVQKELDKLLAETKKTTKTKK